MGLTIFITNVELSYQGDNTCEVGDDAGDSVGGGTGWVCLDFDYVVAS